MKLHKAMIGLGIWILISCQMAAQIEDMTKIKNPDWQTLLKKNPLPANAKKLIKIREFPTDAEEEKGEGFGQASFLNFDQQGNIYVSDWKYSIVHQFNMSGESHAKIGRAGQGPGEFNRPRKMAFDRQGNLFILDEGRRIQKFDNTHKYVESFKIFKAYSDFLVGENGKIYAGYSSQNKKEDYLIEILGSDGSLESTFGKKKEFKYSSPNHNQVLLASGNDQVFVLWSAFNIFQRYSPEGRLLFDGQLKYALFDEISKENDDLMKPEKNSIKSRILFQRIRYCEDHLYTMTGYPRIVIYEFDQTGNINQAYWAEIQENELSADFSVFEKQNERYVVVLRSYPTNRVVLYSIPK